MFKFIIASNNQGKIREFQAMLSDLGEVLGCGGYLIKLVRVKAGSFVLENSVKLEDLKTGEDIEKNLIYPLEYLNYPQYELNEEEKNKISHGISIKIHSHEGEFIILTHGGKISAVTQVQGGKSVLAKVFI